MSRTRHARPPRARQKVYTRAYTFHNGPGAVTLMLTAEEPPNPNDRRSIDDQRLARQTVRVDLTPETLAKLYRRAAKRSGAHITI